MKQRRSGSNATNRAIPSYEEMTDPSLQREVDDGRRRIPSTLSMCWLLESRGLRGGKATANPRSSAAMVRPARRSGAHQSTRAPASQPSATP